MLKDWLDNPVFRRETLVLQRGKIPAVLFFAGPILTSLLFLLWYMASNVSSTLHHLRQVQGREIFESLIGVVFWGLVLFIPALVGLSVDNDRRSGAFTALRLTRLGGWSVLLGKSAAFAAYYSLVYLTVLPVFGMTFLLGGVSFSELLGVFSITLATAIQCSLLAVLAGLLFRRSSTVMLGGFAFSIFYVLFLPQSLTLLDSISYWIDSLIGLPWLETFRAGLHQFRSEFAPYFFPAYGLGKVLSPETVPSLHLGSFRIPFWLGTTAGIGGTCLLSLALATYLMRQERWLRPRRHWWLFRLTRGQGKRFEPENLIDERTNPFLDWELGRNPVRIHLIKALLFGGGIALVILMGCFFWKVEAFVVTGTVVLGLTALSVMVIPIFYCSQTVVREKEMGTYDSLRLTLLQPKQIVESKVKNCLLYTSPVLAVAAIVCLLGHFIPSDLKGLNFFMQMNFAWLGFQVVQCVYYAMLGVYFSLYCRSSLQALAYVIVVDWLLTIPYWIFSGIFFCCGGWLIAGVPLAFEHYSGWFSALIAEYVITIGSIAAKAIFLLIIIRILYDRTVTLVRFESYRH